MLMTTTEFRRYVQCDELDAVLETRLSALERLIRKYTNNNFQQRGFRIRGDILENRFLSDLPIPFLPGDTVMVSGAAQMPETLFTVKEVEPYAFITQETPCDEKDVLITKVTYPVDVKLGAAGILKWQLKNDGQNSGDVSRKDIRSETLSRYSVTYAEDRTESDMDTAFGVPKKYIAFLNRYKKARV